MQSIQSYAASPPPRSKEHQGRGTARTKIQRMERSAGKLCLLDRTQPVFITLMNFQQPWSCAQDLYKVKLVKMLAWMAGAI